MWVAWKRSRGILLGKFSRHQRFRLGSLQAVAAKCIQISWHSPHSSGSKWILCSKNSKLNFWVSGSPYIFGSDVLGHKSSCRKVLQMHTFATDLHVTEYQCLHVTFLGPWIQFCLDNFSLFASPAASLSGAGVLCRRIMVVLVWLCTGNFLTYLINHFHMKELLPKSKNIHSHMTSKPESNARPVNMTHTWHDLTFK